LPSGLGWLPDVPDFARAARQPTQPDAWAGPQRQPAPPSLSWLSVFEDTVPGARPSPQPDALSAPQQQPAPPALVWLATFPDRVLARLALQPDAFNGLERQIAAQVSLGWLPDFPDFIFRKFVQQPNSFVGEQLPLPPIVVTTTFDITKPIPLSIVPRGYTIRLTTRPIYMPERIPGDSNMEPPFLRYPRPQQLRFKGRLQVNDPVNQKIIVQPHSADYAYVIRYSDLLACTVRLTQIDLPTYRLVGPFVWCGVRID
jgi:hypothetical protein